MKWVMETTGPPNYLDDVSPVKQLWVFSFLARQVCLLKHTVPIGTDNTRYYANKTEHSSRCTVHNAQYTTHSTHCTQYKRSADKMESAVSGSCALAIRALAGASGPVLYTVNVHCSLYTLYTVHTVHCYLYIL